MLRPRAEFRRQRIRDRMREPKNLIVREKEHLLARASRNAKSLGRVATDGVVAQRLREHHPQHLARLARGSRSEAGREHVVDEAFAIRIANRRHAALAQCWEYVIAETRLVPNVCRRPDVQPAEPHIRPLRERHSPELDVHELAARLVGLHAGEPRTRVRLRREGCGRSDPVA